MKNWAGINVIVIGAARQGLAASRYLASQGAHVLLTDSRPHNDFLEIEEGLKQAGIRTYFGSHPLHLLENQQLVCVSGGVPLDLPIIQAACQAGIELSNDSQIFMQAVKASVIGVTGSAGKTTTTTLLGEMARFAVEKPTRAWVGGNIGFPLIENLNEIQAQDWVILELSSFQLELMSVSPHIALLLNITPNHLDRHKTIAAYTAAKVNILRYQQQNDIAILNRDDNGSIDQVIQVCGKLLTFGFTALPEEQNGCFINNGHIMVRDDGREYDLAPVTALRLPGRHNLANAMAACLAAWAAGFTSQAIQSGLKTVQGVPHRLELVREDGGVRWYNDSIATAPERVMAALNAIQAPLVLLLGGRDKNLPWHDLSEQLKTRQVKVILFGEAADLIHSALSASRPDYPIIQVNSLEEAVQQARNMAVTGESVMLSPGGTSYDAYRDFEERGNDFRRLVEELA